MKLHTEKRKLTKEEQKEKDRARKKIIFLAYIKPTLRWYHRLFKDEENSLFAWRAYQFCRQSNVSVPEWVSNYFDKVAKNLLIDLQKSDFSNERTGTFIQKALEMDKKGQGNIFKRYSDIDKRIDAVSKILELLQENETIEEALLQISEKTKIPADTLKKWYYYYRKNLLKPA